MRELVIDTFVRYRQLAQEAESVSRRFSQDLFFETVAASSPEPVEKLLEGSPFIILLTIIHEHIITLVVAGEFAPAEEREEREEEQEDARSTVSATIPRISSAATNNPNNDLLESDRTLDARARRRRRVLNRVQHE